MTDEKTFTAAFHRADGSVTRTTHQLVNGEVPRQLDEHVLHDNPDIIFFWRLRGQSEGEYDYDLASTPPVEVDPPGLIGVTTHLFAHPQFDAPLRYTGFEAEHIRAVFEADPRSLGVSYDDPALEITEQRR
jgi:hypothetical protein